VRSEIKPDPRIVQAAFSAVPSFLQSTDAAMIKPIENAFREWFTKNCPPLKDVQMFKIVDQSSTRSVIPPSFPRY